MAWENGLAMGHEGARIVTLAPSLSSDLNRFYRSNGSKSILNIVIQGKLPGVRAKIDGDDLLLHFVGYPRLDHIGCEDIPL